MQYELKNEIRVGIFVAVSLIALLGSILLLGGDQMFLKSKYELKVRFREVQGLVPTSLVSLAGIPVGNIKDLRILPDSNEIEIRMEIDRAFERQITEGSIASVKTQGALGDKYIYIKPGTPQGRPIPSGAFLQADEAGDFLDILTKRGEELSSVTETVKELRLLLAEINRDGRSAALMKNAVDATQNMSLLAKDARVLVSELRGGDKDSLRDSIIHLSSVLRKIDQGNGSLGALINDPSLHDRLLTIIGEPSRNKFLKPLLRESVREAEKSQ